MKYELLAKVDGYVYIDVEANSLEEALKTGRQKDIFAHDVNSDNAEISKLKVSSLMEDEFISRAEENFKSAVQAYQDAAQYHGMSRTDANKKMVGLMRQVNANNKEASL